MRYACYVDGEMKLVADEMKEISGTRVVFKDLQRDCFIIIDEVGIDWNNFEIVDDNLVGTGVFYEISEEEYMSLERVCSAGMAVEFPDGTREWLGERW